MPNIEPKAKRVHVAAGIIFNPAGGEILIAKRPEHLHQGGLWEFPGGKVEGGESILAALERELGEELDILVVKAQPFMQVKHDYSDKAVLLDFWCVLEFLGTPQGLEGQQTRWVSRLELQSYAFPEANLPVVEALVAHNEGE